MKIDIANILKTIKNIHFVGIGGISMSALALVMKQNGYNISGSDLNKSNLTDDLVCKGINFYIGHKAENIKGSELIVYTAAVKIDNPELLKAIKEKIPIIERAVLLGYLIDLYKYPIGISGTHGKTTATSMIASIALTAKIDPTIMVGGELSSINGNYRIGNSPYFIFEACEYSNSFLNFKPFISVILNIDADHLDFFINLDDIINSFKIYCNNTKENGIIIANTDDENVLKAIQGTHKKVVSFGFNNADFTAKDINFIKGYPSFKVYYKGDFLTDITLNVPGIHNVLNSLSAIATAFLIGIDILSIKNGLFAFNGTKRRFELKYKVNGITIIDDYAHHPSEIIATLNAANNMGYKRVICIFQPHTYTRTLHHLKNFASSLSLANKIILAKIYPAREKDIYNISSNNICALIDNSVYFEKFEDIANYISTLAKDGDLIITMGAGDINKVADMIYEKLSAID